MTTGSANDTPNVSAPEQPLDIPENVLQLVARLLAVGAEQVMYTRGGLVARADKSEWDLGLGQWLLVRLPVGELEPDGRLADVQVNS